MNFYNRDAVEVAQDLLGKKLIFNGREGIIIETEAYRGKDDEASHAYRGMTRRSKIMFGPPGHAYVYMIYGMYYCFNIVTEAEGQPSAVLIRGLMGEQCWNGPGKLCKAFGITCEHNGINLVDNRACYLTEGLEFLHYHVTPRIGIRKAMDKPWRFVVPLETLLKITVS